MVKLQMLRKILLNTKCASPIGRHQSPTSLSLSYIFFMELRNFVEIELCWSVFLCWFERFSSRNTVFTFLFYLQLSTQTQTGTHECRAMCLCGRAWACANIERNQTFERNEPTENMASELIVWLPSQDHRSGQLTCTDSRRKNENVVFK